MKNLILISCSSKKYPAAAKAKDLYTSDLFQKSWNYTMQQLAPYWLENEGPGENQVYILSAKYGLVDPNNQVHPYDLSLNDMSPENRKLWSNIVSMQIKHEYPYRLWPGKIYFLCGKEYRRSLLPMLSDHFWRADMETPLLGLGIGQQKQWLNNQLKGTQ